MSEEKLEDQDGPLSDEAQHAAFEDWVRRQLNAQATHLFKQGLIDGKVDVAIAWSLPGRLCIGTVRSQRDPAKAFWVISGDIPTDHLLLKQAQSAREAAKHFAMKWQLQAARLAESQSVGRDPGDAKLWTGASAELHRKAEALYAITEMDEHWRTRIIG